MKILISFIGSNDAGSLIGNEDEGAVLTVLSERQFDQIYLFANPEGVVKNSKITYSKIADHLKRLILEKGYCEKKNIFIEKMTFEDIAFHGDVYRRLLKKLNELFPEDERSENEIFAAISSGTPAMQTAWILLAEANIFPVKLIRAVEKKHQKNCVRVFDVPLLTGISEELQRLKTKLKITKSMSLTTVEDPINLNQYQIKVAKSSKSILIVGETGTGKEVLAQTLHEESGRPKDKFIALNCASLPEQLLESELFGHVVGAFTGANKKKKGIAAEYSDGTLLLDEINSMPYSIQAKLLRFLENGEYRSLGGETVEKSNVRIIAASNESIRRMVAEGAFREDLYFRLCAEELYIPPLRHRKEQIPQLIQKLAPTFQFENDTLTLFENHEFKGNVRELKLILDRVALRTNNDKPTMKCVKEVIAEFSSNREYSELEIPPELEGKAFNLLRKILTNAALNQTDGNAFAAAKLLGVTHPSVKKWSED